MFTALRDAIYANVTVFILSCHKILINVNSTSLYFVRFARLNDNVKTKYISHINNL